MVSSRMFRCRQCDIDEVTHLHMHSSSRYVILRRVTTSTRRGSLIPKRVETSTSCQVAAHLFALHTGRHTAVCIVRPVVGAEDSLATVTLKRQKVEGVAPAHPTVPSWCGAHPDPATSRRQGRERGTAIGHDDAR